MNDKSEKIASDKAERLKQSLTAEGEGIFQLIQDQDEDILLNLLRNPHLNDDHLLVLLQRKDLNEELINSIYRRKRDSLSHPLKLALARNPSTSGALTRSLLPHLRLFELLDLSILPGTSPDQKIAAERAIMQRLPTAPLGQKMTLARRGTATIAAALLKEGQGQVVELCLGNPRLKEASVFQFLRSATAKADTISMIARHERWKQRPNLRLAILKNKKTPEIWFTLWLPKLSSPILQQVALSHKLNPARKRLFDQEKRKRGLC